MDFKKKSPCFANQATQSVQTGNVQARAVLVPVKITSKPYGNRASFLCNTSMNDHTVTNRVKEWVRTETA